MKIRRSSVALSPESKPAAVLARQCERALVAAARSTRISTRRRIHQAAREFIRRHARNRAYLAWVMKRVAANAALAIALLGLGQGVAQAAGMPVYDARVPDPLAGLDAGSFSSLAVGDVDGDGDPDIVASESFASGGLRYYQNTGTAASPQLVERVGSANPFTGLNAGWTPILAMGDLDSDGDLDLLSGEAYGAPLHYFQNTGTATAPAFVERVGAANPANNVAVARSAPALGDLDRDGDLDLVIGGNAGDFRFFRNTGNSTLPVFAEITGAANPFNGLIAGVGFISNPALGDIDLDGDLDLVSGDETTGGFHTFENTGSAATPRFAPKPARSNPFWGESVGLNSTPSLFDLDGDGDVDLVSGERNGGFRTYQNQFGQFVASDDIDPDPLGFPFNVAIPGADFDGDGDIGLFGTNCAYADNTGTATDPQFASATLPGLSACNRPAISINLDGDTDFDVVSGSDLYINGGTPAAPSFGTVQALFPPEPGFAPPVATFGDLDGDGDQDAAVFYQSVSDPSFVDQNYFENLGSATNPSFIERIGAANLLPPVGPERRIQLSDYDGDGDTDALEVPQKTNFVQQTVYWENVGSTTTPHFVGRPSSSTKNPLKQFLTTGPPFGSVQSQLLADLDGDGDRDGFAARVTGIIVLDGLLLENSIVRPSPRYFGPIASPFTTQDAGDFSTIAAGDLDGDGDPDFVGSNSFASGLIRYYENTGTALLPRVVERSSSANPFTGLVSAWTPILALGDLDSDGDLDLLSGDAYGGPLKYFQNTGTATAPAFVERVGAANPANNVAVARSAPALGDLDRDGDLDLVIGSSPGTFRLFLNTGSARNPAFEERVGAANPFNGLIAGVGFISNPALGDVDLDGDLDLVSGDETTGGFHYFENTGTATAASFVSRTGPENPLDSESVGLNSTPALIDLDADGDLDLVSGERAGTFEAYYLPEPSKSLLLSAGVALLGWLRRRRG